MKTFYLISILFCCTLIQIISGATIKYITWNVNDNKRITKYDDKFIINFLQLNNQSLYDIYAITFQENCFECKYSHWPRITQAFIDTIKRYKSVDYKSVGIVGTRKSKYCENLYCLGPHGTTLMMVIAKNNMMIKNPFVERVKGCTAEWLGNDEKGIALVGFTNVNNDKICFGGLHLDVGSLSSRQKCISKMLDNIKSKCHIVFFGGDFNSRPNKKDAIASNDFDDGHNKTFLSLMKITDDLAGSKPFSGPINMLEYIYKKHGMEFSEPHNLQPNFLPTYSMDSKIACKYAPVCYKRDRYPSWTDRIIYYPKNRIFCNAYETQTNFVDMSDHLPVYANCVIS